MTEKTKRRGFRIYLKKPFKPGFVTCMAITPSLEDGTPDTANRVERDMTRGKVLGLAADLLKDCEAPPDLIEQVRALCEAAGGAGEEEAE